MSEAAAWRVVSRAILFTIAVLLALWLLVQISAVIVKLVLAVILAAGMKPLVDRLTARDRFTQGRWRPTRGLVVLVVYLVTILLVALASGLILRIVISEVTNLVNGVPVYAPRLVDQVNGFLDLLPGGRQIVADFDLAAQLSGLVDRLFGVFSQALSVFQYVLGLFSGLLDLLMILLLALYITTDGPNIGRYLRAFLPPDRHDQAARITSRIFQRLGGWVSGQIVLCVIIGSMSWLGLTVIGVPYAVVLALIAGVMEAVPNIGPIIAAVPAVLIAALYSPLQALLVLILYLVIQQLENYVVVPRVMSRAVELHPLAVLLALLVGSELMGVLGAVLAVPVTAAISVIVDEIRSERLAPSVDTSDPALETTAPALETTDPTFDTPAPALDAATPALDEPLPREPISDQRRPSAPVDGQPPSPATQRPPADNP